MAYESTMGMGDMTAAEVAAYQTQISVYSDEQLEGHAQLNLNSLEQLRSYNNAAYQNSIAEVEERIGLVRAEQGRRRTLAARAARAANTTAAPSSAGTPWGLVVGGAVLAALGIGFVLRRAS